MLLKHTTHTQPTSIQSALTTLSAILSTAITEMNYKKENDNLFAKTKSTTTYQTKNKTINVTKLKILQYDLNHCVY